LLFWRIVYYSFSGVVRPEAAAIGPANCRARKLSGPSSK
jgi:hypothetical protein